MSKLSSYPTVTTPLISDKVPITSGGQTEQVALSSFPKAVTKTVATSSSGYVADYICDGSADDIEINAAITAVNSAGGGEVRIKSGTYNLAATISMLSNVTLTGDGAATILNPQSGTAIAAVTTGTMGAIQVAAQSNALIRNLKIIGTNLSSPNGLSIFISESSDVEVYGCVLDNCNGFGIFTSAGFITPTGVCQRVRIHDNYIHGLGKNDLIGGGKHQTGSTVYDVKAYSNTVVQDMSGGGTYGTAIDITGGSGLSIVSNSTYGSIVLGTEMYPNLTTIISNNRLRRAIGSSNAVLINANTATAATTNSSSLVVSGNVFEEPGTIVVRGVSGQLYTNFAVIGNSVIADGSNSTCQLVFVSSGVVAGNSFNTGVNGIQMSSADNLEISGNLFANLTTGINDQTGISSINIGHNTYKTVTTSVKGGSPSDSSLNLTTTQRGALSPAKGSLIYNSSTNKLNIYTGTLWEAITSA